MKSLDDIMRERENNARISYADGVIRGYDHMKNVAKHEAEAITEIRARVGPHSITYEEPSLAACNSGSGASSRGPDMDGYVTDITEHEEKYMRASEYCSRIDDWRNGLPDEQRTIIDDYYFKGESLYWIADRMYMARNSVRKRLRDALMTFPS